MGNVSMTACSYIPRSAGGKICYNMPWATRSVIGGTVPVYDGRRTIGFVLLHHHYQPGDLIMPRLNFGAFLAPHHPIGEHPMLQFRRDLELVEHLDKLGYEEFWCGEHHSSGWGMIGSPQMVLRAARQRSKGPKAAAAA